MRKLKIFMGLVILTLSVLTASAVEPAPGLNCSDYCKTKRDTDCSFDGKDNQGNSITITCHNMTKIVVAE